MTAEERADVQYVAGIVTTLIRQYWRGKIFADAMLNTGNTDTAQKAVKAYDEGACD